MVRVVSGRMAACSCSATAVMGVVVMRVGMVRVVVHHAGMMLEGMMAVRRRRSSVMAVDGMAAVGMAVGMGSRSSGGAEAVRGHAAGGVVVVHGGMRGGVWSGRWMRA
jgi:hypothetical protein